MFGRKTKITLISLLLLSVSSFLFGDAYFTGRTGGKFDLQAKQSEDTFIPALSFQAFFSGQLNFSKNIWSHIEFSIDTDDLITKTLFSKTDSKFQLDELSVIFRYNMLAMNNYFSVYMGTYDPIGSDIFLQRQFGISPITSKITESWMGLAGSLLYPHFGIGISDVIRFSSPVSAGIYTYFNHEDKDYYVFNADFRLAGIYRYFTYDLAAGIGAPIATAAHTDTLLAIETIYWHAGTTMLFGNNHTTSLFIQSGIFNASFTPNDSGLCFDKKDFYLLAEPRFCGKTTRLNISFYSLPEKTVNELLFVNDTLGINLNIFYDSLKTVNNTVNFGIHAAISFPNRTIFDLDKFMGDLEQLNFNIYATPYISANVLKGELNAMISANIMSLVRGPWYKFIDFNIGYKTSF
ncbi:MAG: hypothetical protein HUK25_03940 [Treponema sp.]|nr:hypothetical protein [Treponema sp.]